MTPERPVPESIDPLEVISNLPIHEQDLFINLIANVHHTREISAKRIFMLSSLGISDTEKAVKTLLQNNILHIGKNPLNPDQETDRKVPTAYFDFNCYKAFGILDLWNSWTT
jgi:hypothetical protein